MDLNIHAAKKKLQRTNMLGSIPHQKFSLYHFPTRGRAGVKLGDAWYVSNVSIIFDGFMVLSCLLCMFYVPFYIFLGTNLLIQCQLPVPVFPCFWLFSELILERSPNGRKTPKWFFPERKKTRGLLGQARWAPGSPQAPTPPPGGGGGGQACGLPGRPLT